MFAVVILKLIIFFFYCYYYYDGVYGYQSINQLISIVTMDISPILIRKQVELLKVFEKCTNFYSGTKKLPPKF